MRIVWLFSMVLGHSRLIWATFVMHQDLQAVLRCHAAAFEAIGGVPAEIVHDRMRTAVTGEGDEGIVYNATLLACAHHYGFMPKACRPYRAKTKGKVERPFRTIRQDFFLARSFRNLDDLNQQLRRWLDEDANPSVGIPTASRPEPWPTPPACTPPRCMSSRPISPMSAPVSSLCRLGRSRRYCGWSGASPVTAWSPSAAISAACPTAPANAPSRCIR